MVDNIDHNIGLLIDKLKEKKVFENTLIGFTSDNGGLFGVIKHLTKEPVFFNAH